MFAIHLVQIVGLTELYQTARCRVPFFVASHQLERPFAQGGVTHIGEYSGQILLAQGKNWSEIAIPANATGVY